MLITNYLAAVPEMVRFPMAFTETMGSFQILRWQVFGSIQGDTEWLLKEDGPPPPVGSEHIHAWCTQLWHVMVMTWSHEKYHGPQVVNTVARLPGNADSRKLRILQLLGADKPRRSIHEIMEGNTPFH